MMSQGIGQRVLRKEDDRYLRGRGEFVADIRMAGMRDVAFVRSPVAHATILDIHVPAEHQENVYTVEHLKKSGVKPIVADTALEGFRSSAQPILAEVKVRYVGELVAMCIADTRAKAEDIAATVRLDLEELGVVYDMMQGRESDAPRLHETWPDNLFLTTDFSVNIEAAKSAPIKVTREIRLARQVMAPMEGRG